MPDCKNCGEYVVWDSHRNHMCNPYTGYRHMCRNEMKSFYSDVIRQSAWDKEKREQMAVGK